MIPRPNPSPLVTVSGLAFLGALLLAWSLSTYGPAMGQTGLHNIAAAESLLSGEPLVTSRGELFTLWPPLMPLLFALVHQLGLHYSLTAGILNVLAYFTLLLCTGLLAWKLSGSHLVAVLAQLTILAAPPLFRSMCHVVTEPLFLALVMAGALSTTHYASSGRQRWLLLAALAFALAALQRHVGFVLTLATAVALLLPTGREVGFAHRARSSALFAFAASLPPGIWTLRSLARVGELAGVRPEADTTLAQNGMRAARTLADWVAPELWAPAWRAGLCAGLLLAVLLGLRQLLLPPPSAGFQATCCRSPWPTSHS